MKRFCALVFKDFKIQFRSPIMLIFTLGFPIMYLFLFGFLEKSSTKQLKLWVDKELAYEFESNNEVILSYLESPVAIAIEYMERSDLLHDFEKGKLPIIYYLDNNEKTIYLNINKSKSTIVYNMLRSKFYPVATKTVNLKKKFSMNYALLTMVFNFLLIFSSLNFGSALLQIEIKKHNILILLKSGITRAELIISKLIGVLLMQLASFTLFYIIAISTKQLSFNPLLVIYLPLVVIPTAMLGITFSAITANENVKAFLPMIFWFPSVFYGAIKDSVSPLVGNLLKANPLILISELIEQIIRNDVSISLILSICGITTFLFLISIVLMKRTIIRSM